MYVDKMYAYSLVRHIKFQYLSVIYNQDFCNSISRAMFYFVRANYQKDLRRSCKNCLLVFMFSGTPFSW